MKSLHYRWCLLLKQGHSPKPKNTRATDVYFKESLNRSSLFQLSPCIPPHSRNAFPRPKTGILQGTPVCKRHDILHHYLPFTRLNEILILSSKLELAGKGPEKDLQRWEWRRSEVMTPNQMSTLSLLCKDPWVQCGYAKQQKGTFIFSILLIKYLLFPRHQVTGPHYLSGVLPSGWVSVWESVRPKEMGSPPPQYPGTLDTPILGPTALV